MAVGACGQHLQYYSSFFVCGNGSRASSQRFFSLSPSPGQVFDVYMLKTSWSWAANLASPTECARYLVWCMQREHPCVANLRSRLFPPINVLVVARMHLRHLNHGMRGCNEHSENAKRAMACAHLTSAAPLASKCAKQARLSYPMCTRAPAPARQATVFPTSSWTAHCTTWTS